MVEPARVRRVLLTLAEISLWIAAGGLLLLLAVFVTLGQGWGSGAVHRILNLVDESFEGRIDVDGARVFPNGVVIATHARILDPDGRVVIQVDRAAARVDLWQLIHGRLHLSSAVATGAQVDLAIDQAGQLNIARAFEPRHPQPSSQPVASRQSGGIQVVIDGISVDARRVTLTLDPSLQPAIALDHAQVRGRVDVSSAGMVAILADLTGGALSGPLSGATTLHGRAEIAGPNLTAAAELNVGDTSLQASILMALDTLTGHADLSSLDVGPESLSTWLAPQRPRGAHIAASATFDHGILYLDSFSLRPPQGQGAIAASGSLDLASGDGDATVSGRRVDGRAFFGFLPPSEVVFDLRGRFKDVFSDRRSTSAHLEIAASHWDGQPVGPGWLTAEQRGRQLLVRDLNLAVPGARFIGHGQLSDHRVEGQLSLEAPNLGRVRAEVERLTRVNLPDFEGDLAAQATVNGPFGDLAVEAQAHSQHVSLNGLRAHNLEARLEAPRIGAHMDLRGQVTLGELQVADETFDRIDLHLEWQTPELTLTAAATNRGQAVAAHTRVILPPSLASAELEELELTLPGGEWQLQLPAHADFRRGVSLQGFRLKSGNQQIGLNLAAGAEQLTLAAELEQLDLSRLPFIALRGQKMTGLVTGTVSYRDARHQRSAQAQVEIAGFALDRLGIPEATLRAALNGSHASASIDGTLGSGRLHLQFEGPAPFQPGSLKGDLEMASLNVADFHSLVPELQPFRGLATAKLTLGGSWSLPQLDLNASVTHFEGPWTEAPASGVGPVSLAVQLSTAEGFSKLESTLVDELHPEAELLELKGSLDVGSRALGALLRKPGAIPGHLGGAPVRLELKTAMVPLVAIGRVVPQLATTRGAAQVIATLNGTPLALRGSLQLELRDFGFPHRHLGSIELAAEARDSGLSLQAKMTPSAEVGGQSAISAFWGLRPEELGSEAARRQAPLRIDLDASRLPLALLLGRRSELQGVAQVSGSWRGSLGAPSAKAQVALGSITVQDRPAGELSASAEWDGKLLRAKADGKQPSGGTLAVRGALPLTTAGLGKGPLNAQLKAAAFDLSFFEPVLVQTKTVRALGGVLNADLTVAGTRAAPEPAGTISLTEGELALAGLGELQHIILSARVDSDSLVVERLVANSGGGPFTAQLTAKRGDKELDLSGHFDTDRFGIYVDDQLRALLTSSADLSGKLTFPGPGGDVRISVRRASVRIPSLTQRDLAPTQLDPDIHILSWRGSAPETAPATAAPVAPRAPLFLRVSAPGPISVKGPDVDLTAKADLAVRLASQVDMSGQVVIEKGDVNAIGRTFKIYRANVTFGEGPQDFNPPRSARLDVQAGQEIDGYKVTLVMLGSIGHPVLQLSSDPPLPTARISQLLVSGGGGADLGGQGQAGGGSLATNLLVEGLKSSLKINSPLDVLTVDPNRFEAGKRVTARLYVGVTENYGLAVNDPRVNGTEVHARYDLGSNFALDGRYGTSQAGSFDLQWQHNW